MCQNLDRHMVKQKIQQRIIIVNVEFCNNSRVAQKLVP